MHNYVDNYTYWDGNGLTIPLHKKVFWRFIFGCPWLFLVFLDNRTTTITNPELMNIRTEMKTVWQYLFTSYYFFCHGLQWFYFPWYHAGVMQQSMYSPTHPTAGQPGGYHGGYLEVCCLFKPLGCGGFLKLCPRLESRDLSILKIFLTIQVTAIK